jgi:hypothetical protein
MKGVKRRDTGGGSTGSASESSEAGHGKMKLRNDGEVAEWPNAAVC